MSYINIEIYQITCVFCIVNVADLSNLHLHPAPALYFLGRTDMGVYKPRLQPHLSWWNLYHVYAYSLYCIIHHANKVLFYSILFYTRQSGSLHVPKVKNNLGKWSIRSRGEIVWNTILSLKINPETSEAVFAKTVKKCIINQSLSLWLFYICWYKLRFITFHRKNVYGNLSISFWIILEAPRYVFDVWLTIINDRMLLLTHFVLFYAHHRMYYDERVTNRFGAHKLSTSFSLLLFHLV